MSISVYEWDDFGCNHEISDMCQSHDCRDQLLRLKTLNPDFKATLFAIPAEMTLELIKWCRDNNDWIELGVHGFRHSSNYECNEWTYEQMDSAMATVSQFNAFVPVFRAPGWQISDDCLKWLDEHCWIVADQSYNDARRPEKMKAYVNNGGQFHILNETVNWEPWHIEAYHGHVWNVGSVGSEPNGIYEDFDKVSELVKNAETFQFITELFV